MVASRGNVILAILGIYLILGFLTTFVFSEKEEWTIEKRKAFQKAGCLADFRNDVSIFVLILIYRSNRWRNLDFFY